MRFHIIKFQNSINGFINLLSKLSLELNSYSTIYFAKELEGPGIKYVLLYPYVKWIIKLKGAFDKMLVSAHF